MNCRNMASELFQRGCQFPISISALVINTGGVAVGGTGVYVAVGGTDVGVAVDGTGVGVAVDGTGVGVGVGGSGVDVAAGRSKIPADFRHR